MSQPERLPAAARREPATLVSPSPGTVRAIAWSFRAIAWAAAGWLIGLDSILLLVTAALATYALARAIHAQPARGLLARALLSLGVAGHVALFAGLVLPAPWTPLLTIGAGVFMCHAVACLVDIFRGTVVPAPLHAGLLYLVQLPVFPSGPLSRLHEFREQLGRADLTMASFAYGIRRIVTGLTKLYLIAGPLADVADRIFALRVTRLSTDMAWLGAVSVTLQIYFTLAGFTDLGIGVGRVLGFRYQENFRRPYTADSVREFWRRWNVTLITWLRDYVRLPIAGHDRATVSGFLLTAAGFIVVGAWCRATPFVLPWAVYCAAWLALEALGLGAVLSRVPRILRHAYVLLVVVFGWVLLRASEPGPLLGYLEAMLGFSVAKTSTIGVYLTPGYVTALVCAVVFAGPLVGNISRWRVSVDAATASLVMMLAATVVLVWRWSLPLVRIAFPGAGRHAPRADSRP